MANKKKQKKQLSPAGRVCAAVLGIAQVAFAGLAAWDLAHRDASEVRGPKALWIPVFFANWVGPAAYFLAGIKHDER